MIEVELPDGSIAEFPDGTSNDVIKGALQKRFGGTNAQPQAVPAGEWSAASDADLIETGLGTGTFQDMTRTGMAKAVPFADELVSAVNAPLRAGREWFQGNGFDVGRAYDRNMQVEEELQRRRSDRSPIASTAGQVAGAVGASAPLAAGGFSFLTGAKPTLGSLVGRGAAEGAAYGAVYGAGEGRGLNERALNAIEGAGTGAAVGGGTGALARVGASRVDSASVPSADELRSMGNAAYRQADEAGVIFTPQAVDRLKMSIGKKLVDMGYDPALQPGAAAVVRRIDEMAGQNFTLTGLDSLRKVASNGFIPGNRSNNKAVGDIVGAIDDLVTSPGANDVLSGNAQMAGEALSTARDAWSRMSKSERVASAVDRGQLRAASTGSGGNADNAIRQNLRRILENPRGFTKAEQDALRKTVEGTRGQNVLRLAGKLSPQGNGLMAALGIGGAMVNPALGAASLAGMGAKTAADAMTRGNTRALDTLIRSGGAAPAPQLTALRKAIVEALTRGGAIQMSPGIAQ